MILDRFKLTDKVVIVTGAGRGIGRSCAIALSEVGAIPVCVARTEAQVNSTADQIRACGRPASSIAADVTDIGEVRRLVNDVMSEHGRIDLLLNNAGGGGHGATKDINEKQVPFKEGFWNNTPVIYESEMYCLQNIPNKNNLNIVYNVVY